MTDENGNVSYVVLERADEPITPGTPLNAETLNALMRVLSEDQYSPLRGRGGTAAAENRENLSDSSDAVAVGEMHHTDAPSRDRLPLCRFASSPQGGSGISHPTG